MILRVLVVWCSLTLVAAADKPADLFERAEQLSRSNQKAEAMAKVDEAVAEIDRARAAGEDVSWQAHNGLRFAAKLAREDFLDYKKSLAFADMLFEMADSDYWRVPARLERALTYRAMGDFKKAQAEYDAIAAGGENQRTLGMIPQAEMVCFDLGDEARGHDLLVKALTNGEINDRERFNALRGCVQHAMTKGNQDEAVAWYALVQKMPFEKPQDKSRFLAQAWYEMGQIEESRGRAADAKNLYRQAMEMEDGEMRYRTLSRDALEGIEYFE